MLLLAFSHIARSWTGVIIGGILCGVVVLIILPIAIIAGLVCYMTGRCRRTTTHVVTTTGPSYGGVDAYTPAQ